MESENSGCQAGFIFYADLSPVVGSEQGESGLLRIVQNNVGNKYSPTVIVAAITPILKKPNFPPMLSCLLKSTAWKRIPLYFWNKYVLLISKDCNKK